MKQQKYRERYSIFLSSLQQTEMIMFAASEAIPSLPTQVKKEDKSEIPFFFNLSRRAMSEASGGYKSDHRLLSAEPLVRLAFDGQKDRILAYHELTMIIAHLEAFVIDTLKIIWKANPLLLMQSTHGKKVIKRMGLDSLNPSTFTQTQLEDLYDFAALSLVRSPEKYLHHFRSDLDLNIRTENRLLLRADLDRNAIVHNGGLMNQKKWGWSSFSPSWKVAHAKPRSHQENTLRIFRLSVSIWTKRRPTPKKYIDKLNKDEKAGLVAGEAIPISTSFVIQVYNLVQSLGESIFVETSKKYFGVLEPLKDHERVVNRQSPDMQTNPLDEFAIQAVRNVGGSDEALKNPQHLGAEMVRLMKDSKK